MEPLLISRTGPATDDLAAALEAKLAPVAPTVSTPDLDWNWSDDLDAWASDLHSQIDTDRVAVCTWKAGSAPRPLAERTPDDWVLDVEAELATWVLAIGAAARSCTSGGSVVVVVERPSPLDADGRTAELTVAEGLVAFTRSAALVHGERNVRVNVVTTALFTAPDDLLGLAPPLPSFPGTVKHEVAGAVRSLWSEDACGISGTVVRADGGRSW
ncbi:MAG: SDR family oxidoreductase [Aquihabitans sp.]